MTAPGTPPHERPDVSMDLLRTIRETALDPDYDRAAERGTRVRPPIVLVAFLAAGLLFGLAFGATMRAAPAGAAERVQLVDRIRQLEGEQDALRIRQLNLGRENADLAARQAGQDAATVARTSRLADQAGAAAVRGPGLRVTVDDGPDTTQGISRVLDADLRVLVNALWASGAEAIQVNGHRLSSRTAIRGAGDAVTVDYRSLTRPYVVEAIGDAGAMEEGLAASSAGAWWRGLASQYQMRYTVERASALTIAANPGLGVDRARAVR